MGPPWIHIWGMTFIPIANSVCFENPGQRPVVVVFLNRDKIPDTVYISVDFSAE